MLLSIPCLLNQEAPVALRTSPVISLMATSFNHLPLCETRKSSSSSLPLPSASSSSTFGPNHDLPSLSPPFPSARSRTHATHSQRTRSWDRYRRQPAGCQPLLSIVPCSTLPCSTSITPGLRLGLRGRCANVRRAWVAAEPGAGCQGPAGASRCERSVGAEGERLENVGSRRGG